MAYRFERRSTTPGDYRFTTAAIAELQEGGGGTTDPLTSAPALSATVLSATSIQLTTTFPAEAATVTIARRIIGGVYSNRAVLIAAGSHTDTVTANELYEYVAVAANADGTSARASSPVFVRATLATSPILTQIADAVVAELNDHTFSESFTATRAWAPAFDLIDMANIHVTVVPRTVESATESRTTARREYAIDVAVQKRVANDSESDVLAALAREIAAFFERRRLAAHPAAIWVREENDPVALPEHLQQMNQFTGIVRLSYIVFE